MQLRGELQVEAGNISRKISVEVLHHFQMGPDVDASPKPLPLDAGSDDDVRPARIHYPRYGKVSALIADDPPQRRRSAIGRRISGPCERRRGGPTRTCARPEQLSPVGVP